MENLTLSRMIKGICVDWLNEQEDLTVENFQYIFNILGTIEKLKNLEFRARFNEITVNIFIEEINKLDKLEKLNLIVRAADDSELKGFELTEIIYKGLKSRGLAGQLYRY